MPKIKISKYFMDKYSPEKQSSVLQIGDSKFISNKEDLNRSQNYNLK